jgi:hypothetical protein
MRTLKTMTVGDIRAIILGCTDDTPLFVKGDYSWGQFGKKTVAGISGSWLGRLNRHALILEVGEFIPTHDTA